MSGGKGGSDTTSVAIPEYIERAAQRNLNKAESISQLGYVPQYGPDVAAFTPNQQAAFQNTSDAASAFGMATPTSHRGIMGGMDAPTEYANGVSGYSSQPIFQQSVDQLQAERPGQFDHMNSFFIDPFTGQSGSNMSAPVNYENYNTSAQNSRDQAQAQREQADMQRGNDLAIAQARASAGPSSVYYNNENTVMNTTGVGGGASAGGGNAASFEEPSSTGSYGGSLMTGEPSPSSSTFFDSVNNGPRNEFGVSSPAVNFPNFDPVAFNSDYGSGPAPTGNTTPPPSNVGYTGLGDRLNGGGAGLSGGTYSGGGAMSDLGNSLTTSVDLPGNVASRTLGIGAGAANNANDSGFEGADGGGEGGDGTVICTSMHTLGLISDEVYKLDAEFGERINEADPSLLAGYRQWATPLADYILGDSIGSKLALSIITPLATSWAAQMAHVMRPDKYKPNLLGKVVMLVGHPTCRLVGYMSFGSINSIKKGA